MKVVFGLILGLFSLVVFANETSTMSLEQPTAKQMNNNEKVNFLAGYTNMTVNLDAKTYDHRNDGINNFEEPNRVGKLNFSPINTGIQIPIAHSFTIAPQFIFGKASNRNNLAGDQGVFGNQDGSINYEGNMSGARLDLRSHTSLTEYVQLAGGLSFTTANGKLKGADSFKEVVQQKISTNIAELFAGPEFSYKQFTFQVYGKYGYSKTKIGSFNQNDYSDLISYGANLAIRL